MTFLVDAQKKNLQEILIFLAKKQTIIFVSLTQ